MPERFFILLLLIFPTSFKSFGKGSNNPADRIFTLIFNQQFEQAGQLLEEKKDSLDDFYSEILALDLAWWKYLTLSNHRYQDEFNRIADNFRSSDDKSDAGKIKQLIGLNYSLRFEIMQANYFKAGLLHLKIKNLLRGSSRLSPGNNQGEAKLFGLYQNLFYYFEKKYLPISLSCSGVSKSDALSVLEKYCADEDLIVNSLSNYFVGKIYLEVEKQPGKALACFELLSTRFPGNKILKEITQSCRQKSQSHKP